MIGYVRFGSKADICSAKGHVRFTPESRHWRRYFLGVIGVERATWSSIARSKLMRLSNNAKS
jgi:hypothetical protein